MRENYTEKEKQLMKSFVELKNKNDFSKLQVAYWIKDYLDCFALSWESIPDCTLTLYYESNISSTNTTIDGNYQKLVDFIYFLQELKANGFLKYQYSPTKEEDKNSIRRLYNRNKYTYNENLNIFFQKSKDESKFFAVQLAKKTVVHLDFTKDLDECYNAIIYPLPAMQVFVENNFVTEEKKRFNKTLTSTYISIAAAIGIALLPYIPKIWEMFIEFLNWIKKLCLTCQ